MLLRLFNSVESGQRLENVDQTYLVLASGKPELQKVKFKGHFQTFGCEIFVTCSLTA